MRTVVLLTCHNRQKKTLICLNSLYNCKLPTNYSFEVFLVDDGSVDGTSKAIKSNFPSVNIIQGNGSLFWAGGMRLAWKTALKEDFDAFLLLNDDTILYPNSIIELLKVHEYSLQNYRQGGIYVGPTQDPGRFQFTYGGYKIINKFNGRSVPLFPLGDNNFQICDFANANILLVNKNVVKSIGILNEKYTHSLADFDYTLLASRKGIPVLSCSSFCGQCIDDHGKNWLSSDSTLSERVKYLKSPKHIAYKEYLYFIKRNFLFYLPLIIIKLWARTLFPSIWDKFKK